jgi:phosphate transport system protein
MFKNFMNFWKGEKFLSQVVDEFGTMLENAQTMFQEVGAFLLKGEKRQDLSKRIYALDKKINSRERDIRRRIVKHLAIQPDEDVGSCLVLMSVVKDAERLGDYCKNFLEAAELIKEPADRKPYQDRFSELFTQVDQTFNLCRDAFVNSDEEKAKRIMKSERKIGAQFDRTIEKLATSSLPPNEAVCSALIARYFKRIVAHLSNIASSVVVPVSDIDFSEKEKNTKKVPQ